MMTKRFRDESEATFRQCAEEGRPWAEILPIVAILLIDDLDRMKAERDRYAGHIERLVADHIEAALKKSQQETRQEATT